MKFHELAKELGVSQADLKSQLEKQGIAVRSAVSTLPADEVEKARVAFGKATAPAETLPKTRRVPAAGTAEAAAPAAPEAPAPAAPASAEAAAVAPEAAAAAEKAGPVVTPIEVRKVRPTAPKRPEPRPAPGPAQLAQPLVARPAADAAAGREQRVTRYDRVTFPRGRPRYRARPKPVRKRTTEEAAVVQEAPVAVVVSAPLAVREFAGALGTDAAKVLGALLDLGIVADINGALDGDLLKRVGEALGRQVEVAEAEEGAAAAARANLVTRPPVVTIMGHVDHGKTTLLDNIRKSNVTAQEFGGITQHIGAYQAVVQSRKITFLDTPGHEAFTAMRARGARVTDIAVIVVAADDGVMPQTVEAIDHARAAGVPMVVAINKTDLPSANQDRVKQQLAEQGLTPEEWGGETVCVAVAAKQGVGVEHLLEMVLLVADMQELKGDPTGNTLGTIIEAEMERQRGPLATVLVQQGTLRVGDWVITGVARGRVRSMQDEHGKAVEAAGPSAPVQITGLDAVPSAGDVLEAVRDERRIARLAESREALRRVEQDKHRVRLTEVYEQAQAGVVKELDLILKTDVQGSAEAIGQALKELGTGEIRVRMLHMGVGEVSESDVMLASASNAIIIGFNVRAEQPARAAAAEQAVDVRIYRVIYDILDDVRRALVGMLEPEYQEQVLGRAEVRAVFKIARVGTVAGCYVSEGAVRRGEKMRVTRGREAVFEGQVDSLRHFKEDVSEIEVGQECGIGSSSFEGFQEGDAIEVFRVVEVRRETL